MKTQIFKDYQSLSKATTGLIVDAIKAKKNSLICLASGYTPIGVFEELAKEVNQNNLDLSSCTFLSLDEWVGIDPNDSGSCLTMLKKDCFGPLGLQPHQTEYFNVQTKDLEKECNRINSLIEHHGA